MKLHRFFLSKHIDPVADTVTVTDPSQVHQIQRVLRLGVGDLLELIDSEGQVVDGKISRLEDSVIDVTILSHRSKQLKRRQVTLYCAVLKRDNFEWVVQKATEIGVETIVPITTERTVKTSLNHDRLQRIAQEAAEQSGRTDLPVINEVTPLDEAIELATQNQEQLLVFDLAAQQSLKEVEITQPKLALFIGPEGGFSPSDLAQFDPHSATILSLGQGVLRAETAAIVATFWAVNT